MNRILIFSTLIALAIFLDSCASYTDNYSDIQLHNNTNDLVTDIKLFSSVESETEILFPPLSGNEFSGYHKLLTSSVNSSLFNSHNAPIIRLSIEYTINNLKKDFSFFRYTSIDEYWKDNGQNNLILDNKIYLITINDSNCTIVLRN